MRTVTILLAALLSLTALLSGVNAGMAMDHPHMQSHNQIAAIEPSEHDNRQMPEMPLAAHADMCGMVLCGPFIPLASTHAARKLDMTSVTFAMFDDLVKPFSEDLNTKPPRA